jgi:flagellar basal-body rod protein FlgC
MNQDSILAVSRQGLDIERVRLEAAAHAIEMANTPIRPGSVLQPGTSFATKAHPAERAVHDPTNPMADANGMVHYPAINLVGEMSTLISATRAYEANVRAFNMLRGMQLDALSIGEPQS